MDNSNKTHWGTAVKLGGAFMATCIGSGFATGTEFTQFFTVYGVGGAVGAIIISFLVYFLFTRALFNVGQDLPENQQNALMEYYFGDKIGKVLDWYCAIFVGGCYLIMLSGAGTTLNEYLGWNKIAGACLMALISVVTVFLGLRKLTDIIGVIGPVIGIVTIFIGVTACLKGAGNLASANEIISSMGWQKAGPNFVISGILYPCFAMLTLIPVLPAMGASARNKKTTTAAATFGTMFFHIAVLIIVLGILSNLKSVTGAQVPNLALAKMIGGPVAGGFVILIILGIYSTACPMMWGFCSKITSDEKSLRYRITIMSLTIVGMIATYLFPLGTLINFMYTISGYVGLVVSIGMVISSYTKKKEKKS